MAEFTEAANPMPRPGWKMAGLFQGMKVTEWKVADERMSATWGPGLNVEIDGLVLWDGDKHRHMTPVDVPAAITSASTLTLTWRADITWTGRPYGG